MLKCFLQNYQSCAAVQLRKLVAADETPDTAYACIAVIHSAVPEIDCFSSLVS